MLTQKWEVIAWLLAGLVATKTAVIASLGRAFGLTNNESIRIGLILSQGGEFAFVILSLASQLKVLPENLNQVRVEAGGGGDVEQRKRTAKDWGRSSREAESCKARAAGDQG